MLKKSITYENPFTEEQVTEVHYFHLSKGDIVRMELEDHKIRYTNNEGEELTGLQAKLQRISDSEDGKAIIDEIEDLIRRSFVTREGDKPIKSKELSEEFLSSEAFSQLLYDLCTDAEQAGAFMNGLLPKNLVAEAQRIAAQSADISDAEEATVTQLPVQPQESQGGSTSPAIEAVAIQKLAPGGEFTPPANGDQPRQLTHDEVMEMDPAELQAGLTDGRYTLS